MITSLLCLTALVLQPAFLFAAEFRSVSSTQSAASTQSRASGRAADASSSETEPESEPSERERDQLDETPKLLQPRVKRSESDEDRIHASALYAQGRILLRQNLADQALSKYERAWRYDPTADDVLADIITIAIQLNRLDEAARYAALANPKMMDNPTLLLSLADQASEMGDLDGATKILELWLEVADDKTSPQLKILVQAELGKIYLAQEEYAKGAEILDRLVAMIDDPEKSGLTRQQIRSLMSEPEKTFQMIGDTYLGAGRFEDARNMFERANEVRRQDDQLEWNLARIRFAEKDFVEAERHMTIAFEAGFIAEDHTPYEMFADILKETQESDDAATVKLIEKLAEWHKTQTRNEMLSLFLADTYRQQKRYAESVAILAPLRESRTPDAIYDGLLNAYWMQDDVDEVFALITSLLDQEGNLQLVSETFDEMLADEEFQIALQAKLDQMNQQTGPLEKKQALAAAIIALGLKKEGLADKFFARELAIQEEPDPETYRAWALELMLAEDYVKAAKLFQQAIEAKTEKEGGPGDAELYYLMAGALELAGKTEKAITAARKGVEILPDSPMMKYRVAWVYNHAQQHERALEEYEQLLDEYQDDYGARGMREFIRDARMIQSGICVLLDRLPEAEELLEEVLDEYPSDVGAFNDLGYLWVDQNKKLQRGFRMVQQAVDAEPENAAYLDSLGWAHFRLAEYPEAIKYLKKAVALRDSDGVLLMHLGDAFEKNGQKAKAIETWKKAKQFFVESDDKTHLKEVVEKIERVASE